tara:strand:+ start:292 stop:693 length:402 start_codon:yes stop_codon:yes gene_type:complete
MGLTILSTMKLIPLYLAIFAVGTIGSFAVADENHEIIEKVMKEGMKGDDSPLAKVLDGDATAEETTNLAELIQTLDGTEAPKGDQGDYDDKVAELIAAMDAVAGGKVEMKDIERLDEASNCKACHGDHKPKKE